MTVRRRALTALAAGALTLPLLAAFPTAASAQATGGQATPPAEQAIGTFCSNPTAAQFADVPAADIYALAIRCIATAEITAGGPNGLPADQYGPGLTIRRGQMATFVAKMLDAANARDGNEGPTGPGSQIRQMLPYSGDNAFTDVPDDDVHVASINRLAAAGIVSGGAGGRPATTYSPTDAVSRAQMASFINRAVAFALGQDPAQAGAGAGYTAPEGTDYYGDDASAGIHEANINGITSVGIAVGDGASSYFPARSITRGQMAAFVARTLAQLFDDDRVNSLLELFSGHFAPDSREGETRQVSPGGVDVEVAVNVREIAAAFLGTDVYRLSLVRCENTSRGTDGVFRVTPDGDSGLADAGDPSSRIVAVGGQGEKTEPEGGPSSSVAAQPDANGVIRIDIRNDGAPECVVVVIYVNGGPGKTLFQGGTSERLEVDAQGSPRERFGVSGQTEFVSATAADLPFRVMTRNVYLGTDITRPLRPAPEGKDPNVHLANQVHEMWRIVNATNFPERAKLLAKEITDTDPDVVGLQEVATWRTGAFQYPPPQDEQDRVIANAEQVRFDFLALLQGELNRLGEPYDVVNVQAQSDVEAPGFKGDSPFAADAEAADYRLTMHDVMLKRSDSPVVVEESGGANYDAVLPFDLGGFRYEFIRGYNWADVRLGADRVRVLNTHLESQLSSFAMYQARELVAEQVNTTTNPIIMTCDCNSDPLDTSTKQGEPEAGIKHQDPYLYLREHLDDAWLQAAPGQDGFTSGLNETVDEPAPASFTHRIDFVLTRGLLGTEMPASQPAIVGADPANRTAAGLWPSDHAGVVVTLQP